MSNNELKPCPFDTDGTHSQSWMNEQTIPNPKRWWIYCGCGATGPKADSLEKAREGWNRRLSPPASPLKTVAWAKPEAYDGRANPAGVLWLPRTKQISESSTHAYDNERAASFSVPLVLRSEAEALLASRPDSGMRGALADLEWIKDNAFFENGESFKEGQERIGRVRAALSFPQEAGAWNGLIPLPQSKIKEALVEVERFRKSLSGCVNPALTPLENAALVLSASFAAPLVAPTPPLDGEALEYVREVHDRFKQDLKDGYQTKDKEYAVDLLGRALRSGSTAKGEEEVEKSAFNSDLIEEAALDCEWAAKWIREKMGTKPGENGPGISERLRRDAVHLRRMPAEVRRLLRLPPSPSGAAETKGDKS